MADLHAYRVGALYLPGRTSWPEGTDYSYRSGGHELRLFWRSPSASEVRNVKSGPASFALSIHGPVIFLLYRFGGMPWSDQPFTIHLVPEDQRAVPPPTGISEGRALLTTILVDASTGIVRVLRALSWSPAFTAAMHLAIREQDAAGWPGQAAYDRALADTYRHYPTADALLATARSRTEGGR